LAILPFSVEKKNNIGRIFDVLASSYEEDVVKIEEAIEIREINETQSILSSKEDTVPETTECLAQADKPLTKRKKDIAKKEADNQVLQHIEAALPDIITYKQLIAFCHKLADIKYDVNGQYPDNLAASIQAGLTFVNDRIVEIKNSTIDIIKLKTSIQTAEQFTKKYIKRLEVKAFIAAIQWFKWLVNEIENKTLSHVQANLAIRDFFEDRWLFLQLTSWHHVGDNNQSRVDFFTDTAALVLTKTEALTEILLSGVMTVKPNDNIYLNDSLAELRENTEENNDNNKKIISPNILYDRETKTLLNTYRIFETAYHNYTIFSGQNANVDEFTLSASQQEIIKTVFNEAYQRLYINQLNSADFLEQLKELLDVVHRISVLGKGKELHAAIDDDAKNKIQAFHDYWRDLDPSVRNAYGSRVCNNKFTLRLNFIRIFSGVELKGPLVFNDEDVRAARRIFSCMKIMYDVLLDFYNAQINKKYTEAEILSALGITAKQITKNNEVNSFNLYLAVLHHRQEQGKFYLKNIVPLLKEYKEKHRPIDSSFYDKLKQYLLPGGSTLIDVIKIASQSQDKVFFKFIVYLFKNELNKDIKQIIPLLQIKQAVFLLLNMGVNIDYKILGEIYLESTAPDIKKACRTLMLKALSKGYTTKKLSELTLIMIPELTAEEKKIDNNKARKIALTLFAITNWSWDEGVVCRDFAHELLKQLTLNDIISKKTANFYHKFNTNERATVINKLLNYIALNRASTINAIDLLGLLFEDIANDHGSDFTSDLSAKLLSRLHDENPNTLTQLLLTPYNRTVLQDISAISEIRRSSAKDVFFIMIMAGLLLSIPVGFGFISLIGLWAALIMPAGMIIGFLIPGYLNIKQMIRYRLNPQEVPVGGAFTLMNQLEIFNNFFQTKNKD
ncbi:MAG: hypothetical protein ACK4PR_03145, partial [Gammaproteobacteria bacterium]